MKENDMSNTSKTDWARIDAMTDEDIDTKNDKDAEAERRSPLNY